MGSVVDIRASTPKHTLTRPQKNKSTVEQQVAADWNKVEDDWAERMSQLEDKHGAFPGVSGSLLHRSRQLRESAGSASVEAMWWGSDDKREEQQEAEWKKFVEEYYNI